MFAISSATTDTGPVLTLSGEVDFAAADAICEVGKRMLAAAGGQPLTVDLAAVSFIDAAGLAVLITLSNAAAGMHTTLRLRSVPSRVAQLLDLTGLSGLLADDLDARSPR